jgi:sensor histidine kinase YesM
MKRFFKNDYFFSGKIVQHLLFWSVVIIIELFTLSEEIYGGIASTAAIWYHLLKILFTIIATYINYLILIPTFLKKRKFILFVVFNIINLTLFSFLAFMVIIISYSNGSIYKGNDFAHHILFTLSVFYVLFFIAASTLVYFVQEWYKLKDVANELILSEKEKIESEHNALKAQLNPHFMFNTLNNIYALSLVKSNDTPRVVLKLSELMSYILYECNANFVRVQKEIDFLNNYIELEKIRTKRLNVEFITELNGSDFEIAPLIFIPFVENAFKHSKSDSMISAIEILLRIDEQANLYFCCMNNKGNEKINLENKYGGFGIENVRKRLSLVYPNKHRLEISDTIKTYSVELNINLNTMSHEA